jgi:hypothetical protein
VAVEVNAALRAGKGAFLDVSPLMQQEADLQAEASATLCTAEGPLTGMSSPVAGESRLICKALGAIRTGERALGAAVDPKVVGESGGVGEGPGTVWTGGGCFTSMVLGSAAEVRLQGKVLGALGTG